MSENIADAFSAGRLTERQEWASKTCEMLRQNRDLSADRDHWKRLAEAKLVECEDLNRQLYLSGAHGQIKDLRAQVESTKNRICIPHSDQQRTEANKYCPVCLVSQVEVLTGQLERSQKAVLEWEDREAKVCPENVSFESVIERLTKEMDQAQAACAVQYEALLFVDDWDDKPGEPMIGKVLEKVRACFVPNPGQPLLDRLHGLEQGVKVAVEVLEDSSDISGVEARSNIEKALGILTPLLTTPTKA